MHSSPAKATASEPTNWALIRRLLLLGWKYKAGSLKVLFLHLLLLTIGLSGLGFTGLGIDFVRHEILPQSRVPRWPFGFIPPADWSPMNTLFVIAAAIFMLSMIRASLHSICTLQTANLVQGRIVVDLRTLVYNKLQYLSFRFFDDNESGSIINRVTRDVQATRMFIDGVLLHGIIMLLSLIVFLTYMLNIHAALTAVCLATTPFLWILTAVFSRIVKPAYLKNRGLYDKMVLVLSETIQGIHVIKGFAREKEALDRYDETNRNVRDQNFWIFTRVSRFTPSVGFLTHINLVVLLGYGGYLVIRDELPLGTGLIVFAGLLQQFSNHIANLSNLSNNIQESLSGARRVFEVLDTPVEIKSLSDAQRLPTVRGAVTFDRVTFGYDPTAPVLHDIRLDIQPGQCIAILGATGSGKSTLLSLIPRFYDPVKGRVLIDGTDARKLDVQDIRRHVGIVFQENFLFSNTVAANIAFGNPAATDAQIEQAARVAIAHDFITALPQGYNTVLNEGGVGLSGGQRQRIAIARALLLEPAILLLDDPTAAIDSETEFEILEAMTSAMRGRTTFMVAHRLSTLRRSDRIVVLEHGRIVQSGTHEELMALKGPYRSVATLQIMDFESIHNAEEASV